MKECCSHKKRDSLNKIGEWKNLEKRNTALTELVKQFPVFTRIYKENLILKQDRKGEETTVLNEFDKVEDPTKRTAEESNALMAK